MLKKNILVNMFIKFNREKSKDDWKYAVYKNFNKFEKFTNIGYRPVNLKHAVRRSN